jgi:hypothetical protein
LKLLLKPGAGQHRVVVSRHPELSAAFWINGRPIFGSLHSLAFNFAESTEAEIELITDDSIEVTVIGYRYELPAAADKLRKARPGWAVPLGTGDHTIVFRRVRL